LRVIVINFQSIKNKIHETQVLIDNADPDIILGTETWLNGNISSAEILPTNFQVFRNDRSDSYGGVLIAVREDLICSPVLTSQKTELISVKLQLNRAKSIIISSFYRSPNMTEDTYSSAALEELIKLKHDNQKSDFWIGGDFNLPDMNWSSLTVTSNQYSYAMTYTYLDILSNCNVEHILNKQPGINRPL
jgi:exonuclease III